MENLQAINFDLIAPHEVKQILIAELLRRGRISTAGKYAWKTAQGNYIRIEDMTFKHIENCLKMAERLEAEREIMGDFDPV